MGQVFASKFGTFDAVIIIGICKDLSFAIRPNCLKVPLWMDSCRKNHSALAKPSPI
jgi:hypothetical protein